ncbi:NAD-dependent epimerase/dehydratase family protein [Paenibacillus solisilvae]|uniref:NAD-dependent epimerase/dehydratase family protein n=1 Tax=Paenibacillus solisilvae TaxID=2486751 RepID=A0ABW0W9U5_9BACL
MDEESMSRPRLVITGAGGFSGEHACRHFSSQGWEVTAVLREQASDQAPAWLQQVETVAYCDLSSRQETETLIQLTRPEYVLHLAGMNAVASSWKDPIAALQSNVMGTVHLLEAVRQLNESLHQKSSSGNGSQASQACRILVIGSMLRFKLPLTADSEGPPHPYSLSKTMQVLAAQSWASLYGLEVIAAEPANLIGPGRSTGLCTLLARFAAETERAAAGGMQQPGPFKLSSRTETRDLLDVRDAVRAYELLLRSGVRGRVYPVTSGRLRTIGELADRFDQIAAVPLHWEVGQSQAPSPVPDSPAAIRELGWHPQITIEQSISDVLEYARSRH